MKTEKYNLSNGATVLVTKMAEVKSTTLLVTVPHGSRHETVEQAGLAHFFEHMVFKGAKKYKDAAAISQALDQYGAVYNAFTDFEQTAYYAKIATAHFDVALDVISDYLQHPKLLQSDIDKESNVIIEELNMYWDVPRDRASMQINQLVFGDTPLGRPIIGTKETVKSFKRADFEAWREQYYGADKVTISVAGAIPNNLKEQLEQAFCDLPPAQKISLEGPQEIGDGPKILMDERAGEQINLIMAFPALKTKDENYPDLQVLRAIMGSSMSSRLFSEIREKRGLCYSIGMGRQAFTDTGSVYIAAGLDAKKIDEAVEAIWHELMKIAQEEPGEQELFKAKENIKGGMVLGLEDSSSVAASKASQWMFEDKIVSPEERAAEIDAVTASGVSKMAKKLFVANKVGMVLVGPKQDVNKLRSIVSNKS